MGGLEFWACRLVRVGKCVGEVGKPKAQPVAWECGGLEWLEFLCLAREGWKVRWKRSSTEAQPLRDSLQLKFLKFLL